MKKIILLLGTLAFLLTISSSLVFADNVFASETPKVGDFNGDGSVDSDDAIYLLMHTVFPNDYPLNQKVLFNNEVVDSDAAIYLLMFTVFPDEYPIDGSVQPTPPEPPKPYVRENIVPYQNGPSVKELKIALNKLGFLDSDGNKLVEDEVYDEKLYSALYAFQEDFDLDPDGYASAHGWTWNKIDEALANPFDVKITVKSADLYRYRQGKSGTTSRGETYTGMIVNGRWTYLKEVERWVENTAYAYDWHADTNEESAYNYLTHIMGLNSAAACGIIANLNAESNCQPDNFENYFTAKYRDEYGLNITDEVYTRNVDNGTYRYSRVYHDGNPDYNSDITVSVDIGSATRYGVGDSSHTTAICDNVRDSFGWDRMGYGICQWTWPATRKLGLYDMAKSEGKSIGDLGAQLDYLLYELENSYSLVYSEIKSCSNDADGAYDVADIMCRKFEAPAGADTVAPKRGDVAKALFAKYNK